MARTKRLTAEAAAETVAAMTDEEVEGERVRLLDLMPIITRGSSAIASDNLFVMLDAIRDRQA